MTSHALWLQTRAALSALVLTPARAPIARRARRWQKAGMGDTSLLLTLSEVAGLLRVSTRTLQRWVRGRRFPQPIRPGDGRPLWRRADVELFVTSGSIHAFRRAKRPD